MNNVSYFGHIGEVKDPFLFFQQQGYITCRGATDLTKIDNLFNFYNQVIVNSKKEYLRYSTYIEPHNKTNYGGIRNAFLNPHSYEWGINRKFSNKILNVLACEGIRKSLSEISGKSKFSLFQTILLDQSTARPHQDWIYLDSRPNGHVVGVWVALEDIYSEGIRFFVYPGSQNFIPKARYNKQTKVTADIYKNFLIEIDEYLSSQDFELYAPPLQKGDIFFWSSKIIHGSIAGENPKHRRRSIAAHFLPEGFQYGNLEMDFDSPWKEKYGLKYAYHNLDDSKISLKRFLRKFKSMGSALSRW